MKVVTYPDSVIEVDGTRYSLARCSDGHGAQLGKVLVISGDHTGFEGERWKDVLLCPRTDANAAALRQRVPWLRPQPLGLKMTAGCGDRLGSATPGHIRAVRAVGSRMGKGMIAPVLAQQSMRENARTGRTPLQVLDDAMWGVLQEGWREPWGADADHLKTTADVDLCLAAGYPFYTIDPGDFVDNEAHYVSLDVLKRKLAHSPWRALDDSQEGLCQRYLGRQFSVEDLVLEFSKTSLLRASAKYGGAIAHTTQMYRHLVAASGSRPFELEVSIDETETPTSPLEHLFIANELRRLRVQWVSLAPRYVGRFEKGVDYIGDLVEFEDELVQHAAIARAMGPYKLSIHSGSDKFSVYPIFARCAGNLVHLKTAGTSYLEALRALADLDASLFRSILDWARERYDDDKATYHMSADLARVPSADTLDDSELEAVLDTFDGREVLHVTFGSVVDRYGMQLHSALEANEEAYYDALEAHFVRHFSLFAH